MKDGIILSAVHRAGSLEPRQDLPLRSCLRVKVIGRESKGWEGREREREKETSVLLWSFKTLVAIELSLKARFTTPAPFWVLDSIDSHFCLNYCELDS